VGLQRALVAFKPFLVGKTVLVYSDNQNVGRIVDHGSRKSYLQSHAVEIFRLLPSRVLSWKWNGCPGS
jgi:hypothetical protein